MFKRKGSNILNHFCVMSNGLSWETLSYSWANVDYLPVTIINQFNPTFLIKVMWFKWLEVVILKTYSTNVFGGEQYHY